MGDPKCKCGHERAYHIYEQLACRSGVLCPCQGYDPGEVKRVDSLDEIQLREREAERRGYLRGLKDAREMTAGWIGTEPALRDIDRLITEAGDLRNILHAERAEAFRLISDLITAAEAEGEEGSRG